MSLTISILVIIYSPFYIIIDEEHTTYNTAHIYLYRTPKVLYTTYSSVVFTAIRVLYGGAREIRTLEGLMPLPV